jgi:hypothetical protein
MAEITTERPITGAGVEPLREQVRGRVITAADDDYGEARAVHNGMFAKRPLAVLRAEQVADVIVGVNFDDSVFGTGRVHQLHAGR